MALAVRCRGAAPGRFPWVIAKGRSVLVKGGAGEEASVPGREARSGVWRPLSRGRKVAACGWEILFLWGGGFACSGRLDDHPAVARYAFWLAAGGWRLAAGGWCWGWCWCWWPVPVLAAGADPCPGRGRLCLTPVSAPAAVTVIVTAVPGPCPCLLRSSPSCTSLTLPASAMPPSSTILPARFRPRWWPTCSRCCVWRHRRSTRSHGTSSSPKVPKRVTALPAAWSPGTPTTPTRPGPPPMWWSSAPARTCRMPIWTMCLHTRPRPAALHPPKREPSVRPS